MIDDSKLLLKRRVGCSNSLLDVYLDDIVSETNEVISNYIVVSPKIKNSGNESGVVILPIIEESILLINIYRHPLKEHAWELPRGFINPSETAHEAAIRELNEETGISTTEDRLVDLGLVAPEPGVLAAKNHIFLVKDCEINTEFSVNEYGHKEIRKFSRTEVIQMIEGNNIYDSNTLVAIYKYFTMISIC